MSINLLCIGDIHLGRNSSKIPNGLVPESWLNITEALNRAISYAQENSVDAVLFVGDIADSENAFIEAYIPLREAFLTLVAADIPIFAVSGNHDFELLSQLASSLKQACPSSPMHILGADGRWESQVFYSKNNRAVRITGRSFTSSEELTNPLSTYRDYNDALPTIGLLHCDVDNGTSRYAPVPLHNLQMTSNKAWVLGHIHKPTLLSEAPLIFYPGSLQGMDPGESEGHGPWLLQINLDGQVTTKQILLSPVRYQQLEISIADPEYRSDSNAQRYQANNELEEVVLSETLPQTIIQAIDSWHRAHLNDLEQTGVVVLRLTLTGATKHYSQLHQLETALKDRSPIVIDRTSYLVEKVILKCSPAVSLNDLVKGHDPLALLAQRITILNNKTPESEYGKLLGKEQERQKRRRESSVFAGLTAETTESPEDLRQHLLSTGWLLLNLMLEQERLPGVTE